MTRLGDAQCSQPHFQRTAQSRAIQGFSCGLLKAVEFRVFLRPAQSRAI